MKKKRTFESSELVKSFAKIYGFEDKLLAMQVKDFLFDYLDQSYRQEIEHVNLKENILEIKVKSALLRNDFRMKKTFFLKKIQEQFRAENIMDLYIL